MNEKERVRVTINWTAKIMDKIKLKSVNKGG